MKWYRDKKWLVGIILALVGIFVSVGAWIFAKSSNQNSIGTISGNSGAIAQGNYNIINVIPHHSFSSTQTINTLPSNLGGKSILNLDNVGTLRLFVPDSIDQATLVLDTIPMKFPDQGSFTDIQISSNIGPKYTFDTGGNKRHEVTVAGRTFVITLLETKKLDIPNVGNPLEYKFGVSDK